MVNFFRKIRKKMADDNKPIKYARYAIGEIVLVVIGILIALQINNWNEERKGRINQVKFLNNLRNEIELDTLVIGELTFDYNRINEQLKQTIQFLNRPTGVSEEEYQIIILAIANLEVLTPNYKNIEKNDVKLADGTLFEIHNQLNKKYQQYLEKIKSNNDIIRKLGESLQFVALHNVYPKVDLDYVGITDKKIYFDIEELKNDRLFKNAINRSFRYRNVSISFMNHQKEQAIELLKILSEELK